MLRVKDFNTVCCYFLGYEYTYWSYEKILDNAS